MTTRKPKQLSISDAILGSPRKAKGEIVRRRKSAGMVARAIREAVSDAIESGASPIEAASAGAVVALVATAPETTADDMLARARARQEARALASAAKDAPETKPAPDADPGLQVAGLSAKPKRSRKAAPPTSELDTELAKKAARAQRKRLVNLKPGDVLIKVYKGTEYKVTILEDGKAQLGRKVHESLKAAARAIVGDSVEPETSARISPTAFFGLAPARGE